MFVYVWFLLLRLAASRWKHICATAPNQCISLRLIIIMHGSGTPIWARTPHISVQGSVRSPQPIITKSWITLARVMDLQTQCGSKSFAAAVEYISGYRLDHAIATAVIILLCYYIAAAAAAVTAAAAAAPF